MNPLNNNNWYYNPQYFTQEEYYRWLGAMQAYEQQQTAEMAKAIKAWNDFLDSIQKIDQAHQLPVQVACLIEFGRKMGW